MASSTALSANDKLTLISNLYTMISAGIPILEAVDSVLEEAKGNQKKILLTLREDISQGRTIGSSFEKFPRAFDKVTVNLIKASEQAGTLDTILKDLTANIKKDIELSDKVKAALAYPALVLAVFFGVLTMILVFVIPRIASVFSRLNVKLPLATRVMISASNLIRDYTLYVIMAIVILVGLFVFLYKTKRQFILNILYSLPVISKLAIELDLTRFTRSLSLLLNSGIPIVESIEMSAAVVYKRKLQNALRATQAKVAAGVKLSTALKEKKGVIPSMMIRVAEAGEKSGSLGQSMQDLSEHFDGRVTSAMKNLTTLLEPLLLLAVGLLVGGMMLAIIAPIYGLIGQIQR